MPSLSVVIPARNKADNIVSLIAAIDQALAPFAPFEIIVVDDGLTADCVARLVVRAASLPHLRVLRHDQSAGQSAGVQAARAAVVLTLDGDGQNPSQELPKLAAPLLADTTGQIGLVAGQRVGRQDTWSKKVASRLANAHHGWILQDSTRHTGCGLKAFRRDAFLALPYFNHMHRYLPALFARDGWQVAHVDVAHRSRGAGRSNYSNLQRGLVGVIDLMGGARLLRRAKTSKLHPVSTLSERP